MVAMKTKPTLCFWLNFLLPLLYAAADHESPSSASIIFVEQRTSLLALFCRLDGVVSGIGWVF